MVDAKGQVQWAELLQRVQGGLQGGSPTALGLWAWKKSRMGTPGCACHAPNPNPTHLPTHGLPAG